MNISEKWKTVLFILRGIRGERDVFYIGGSEVLPPPLEMEEEQKCLSALMGRENKEAK